MKRNFIFILLFILVLSGCIPCDSASLDKGSLDPEALLCVPYQDGETLSLQHSSGLLIHYSVLRQSTIEMQHPDHCGDIIQYESNKTTLSPDYPTFDIRIEIDNFSGTADYGSVWMSRSAFIIPTKPNSEGNYDWYASFELDGQMYENVFIFANPYVAENTLQIYVDTLYYNYEQGILKITMSNDEYYQIPR